MVATLAVLYNTLSSALSYDAPSLYGASPPNLAGHGDASLTLAGSDFAATHASLAARVGGTACEATIWQSASSVACRAPQSRGGTHRAAVTVGGHSGSVTDALSFDAPLPLAANGHYPSL